MTSSEQVSNVTESISGVTLSGEPLLPATGSVARSFSYPALLFEGDVVSEIETTITWNSDGTIDIKDNRGYELVLAIPPSQGNMTLLANSTVVNQKIIGSDLQYDIYWLPGENPNGYVDRYEFIMAGSSGNASSMVLDIVDSDMISQARVDDDTLAIGNVEANDLDNADNPVSDTNADGLLLDWSDAIASGVEVRYDTVKSELMFPVKENSSFFIDPYIVATTNWSISPSKALAFDDQLRLITTSNETTPRVNAFYYDGSNIVYKTSDDEGDTWSSPISLSTGALATGRNRWTIAPSTSEDGDDYVHLFYWTESGGTTTIKTKRGDVNGLAINWGSVVQISNITNAAACPPGACVSATATSDIEGTVYAAFSWNTTNGLFSFVIKKSTDNGLSWSDSLSQINGFAANNIGMTLTELEFPKMLFVYAKGESANLFYRTFNGTSWGSEQSISNNGMQQWTRKQLSSIYHEGDGKAYVAYSNVTTSSGGILKVAKFFSNGTFEGLETVDSSLRHYIPNILQTPSGDISINSIANGLIYNTRKFAGTWEAPFNPYGTSFNNPDDLTATTVLNGQTAALWKEGASAPYNVIFGLLHHGIIEHSTTIQNSPAYADYFEGERRVAENSNGTLFAFYYDGSNIVYKRSFDNGHSWSAAGTSTGTGALASDSFRWTISYGQYNGTDRLVLLYYTVSGSNTNFYQKTFNALDSGLQLISTVNSFSAPNDASCSPTGTCAAAAGSFDADSTFYAAYRWKSGGTWHYKILKSLDGGSTWSTSLDTNDVTSTSNRFPITVTLLGSKRMLFAYTTYESPNISYRIFNGTVWGSTNTVSAGISANTVKQISSGTVNVMSSSGEITAYVAFLASGNQGTLKVAVFSSNGNFLGIETADSTIVHWLPSISVTGDGIMHVYSLYNNVIYDTQKIEVATTNPGFEFVNYGSAYSPSAHWQFENDTLDYSGNVNDGTLFGNSTFATESLGLAGWSLNFDGSGDYVRVSDSTTLDISGNVTISTWVSLNEQTNDFRAIVKKDAAYSLEKNHNNLPRFTIWSGGESTPVVLGTTALQVGKWYHIVGTYDGSYLRMYVNGVLEGTTARSGAITTNNIDLYIGSKSGTSQFINATLDDVMIYNRSLSAQEIQSVSSGWDLRGGMLNTANTIFGQVDLVRSGQGDTRSASIPASPGKLYTLESDVNVTSGFAKIELNFLNSSGAWLTNNTLPASGISATSTTGSIQHLSASWIAPASTASMIVRLINNVSGGLAKFDSVRVTTWQNPVAPYGTDFYSPDQLTAQIAGPESTGVLWRSGSNSPYELHYAGAVAGEVVTTNYLLSPKVSYSYEGEKRLVRTSDTTLFAFYYSGTNIRYKYSTNNGATWSSSSSTQSGYVNTYYYRWTLAVTKISTTNYVTILYHKTTDSSGNYVSDGDYTTFFAKRGKISGTTIEWASSPTLLFTVPNETTTSDNADAAITAATGKNGYMYAAFRWQDQVTEDNYYRIMRSSNGGLSWCTTLGTTPQYASESSDVVTMALTRLAGNNMIFVYLREDDASVRYRTYTFSSTSCTSGWSGVNTYSSSSLGLSSGPDKQASADSDSTGKPYLAYVTGGTIGQLRVVTWNTAGSSPTVENVDSLSDHRLPSIRIYFDTIYVYTVRNDKIWLTYKVWGIWEDPLRPYNNDAVVRQLTIGLSLGHQSPSVMWGDGSTTPYTLKKNGLISWGSLLGPFTHPLEICGGGFLDPHPEQTPAAESGVFRSTLAEIQAYLVGLGYHQVPNPYAFGLGRDYAKFVSAYGCSNDEFRDQAGIVQRTSWTYVTQANEPNPETDEYPWPVWWWDPYTYWWHWYY